MSFPDRRTTHVLLTALLFAVIIGIAYMARTVIIIFCFAILFAYLLDPMVRFLQRHSLFFKNLRGPHIAEAYVAALLLIALVVHTLAPGFPRRAIRLAQQLPALADRLSTGEVATDMASSYGWSDAQALRVKTFLVNHRSNIQNLTASIQESAKIAFTAMILIPILAIFFLSEGEALVKQVIRLAATEGNYDFLQSLAADLHSMMEHYIRAKVILGGLSFIYATTALLILGFPHAIALGLLAGVLEFIPMAGWMITATIIITVGVLTHSHWLVMAVLLGLWRMMMDYAIAPRVLGHELEIPPLLAIFTLMVGATVGGLPGVYLSLPFVAAIRVVLRSIDRRSHMSTAISDHGVGATGVG